MSGKFRVWNRGFRGFGVVGFRVQGLGLGSRDVGFGVWGFRRVWGLEIGGGS